MHHPTPKQSSKVSISNKLSAIAAARQSRRNSSSNASSLGINEDTQHRKTPQQRRTSITSQRNIHHVCRVQVAEKDTEGNDKQETANPTPPPSVSCVDLLFRKLSVTAPARQQGCPSQTPSANPEFYDAGRYFKHELSSITPSVLLSMFHSACQSLFHGSSNKSSSSNLIGYEQVRSQNTLEALSAAASSARTTERDGHSKSYAVRDIRTVLDRFDLDPATTIYATCPLPVCSAIYPPTFSPGSSIPVYPIQCKAQKFGKECGASLISNTFSTIAGVSIPKPARPYAYHHFNDHVSSMLSRSGIEQAISQHLGSSAAQEELRDIMSSTAIRNLKDTSGQPFLREIGNDLRLVWALSIDWYNPRTNKASGKAVSFGMIIMICLSLPPHLRYKEENIYLAGVIPGPQEPSVDATNHSLSPLMNDLRHSYEQGTYISQTHDYPMGRKSQSAVVPLIADTLASKKVTGHHGHASKKYFCSRCRLNKSDIGNIDLQTFGTLSSLEHRAYAEQWKNAPSKAKQKSLLQAHGVRWSVLLTLPYWQPSDWTITEGLHVLLLGVVRRHCRDLLGLDINSCEDEEDQDEDPPTEQALKLARDAADAGLLKKLKKTKVNALKALVKERNIKLPETSDLKRRRPSKRDYIALLLGQASFPTNEVPAFDQEDLGSSALFTSGPTNSSTGPVSTPGVSHTTLNAGAASPVFNIVTKKVLLKIREQISRTVRPSWQASLPANFGAPEHGKLKGDQWRTALEFDIPVSLIQLLAESSQLSVSNISYTAYLQKFVENTLDLTMALAWGLSRRSSELHAERYTLYMQRYLSGIQALYPDYELKPVHHYSLHIPEILRLFGPQHGTWAFSPERIIGSLQSINTNSRLGQMEITTMQTFCRRANLVRLVESKDCPAILKQAWNMNTAHIHRRQLEREHDDSGACASPYGNGASVDLGNEQRLLDSDISAQLLLHKPPIASGETFFNETKAIFIRVHHTSNGVRYTDFHTHYAHSLIYYSDGESASITKVLKPAQIRQIFSHIHINNGALVQETYAAIHDFLPASLKKDFFAQFCDFRAAVYKREPCSRVKVIKIKSIQCHANQRPWDQDCVVMRAIDRVGLCIKFYCSTLTDEQWMAELLTELAVRLAKV